jgi:signal transduction histidine kinase
MPTPHTEVDLLSAQVVNHHAVQFYHGDEFLARVVARFIGEGLRAGAPAIVVASAAHRRAISAELDAAGCDVDAAIAGGRILLFDARELLTSFLVDGKPDEGLFQRHVGAAVERTLRAFPRARLRAYGEMVDLLWSEGAREAALELEELWNRLAETHPFTLLCSYALDRFPAGGDGDSFDRVCAIHTRVVPTERYREECSIEARHREIAQLQQRARALEQEVFERARAETALRRLEDELRHRNDSLSGALRMKDEFLAMLGHELRNPLAPILSALQLLRLHRGDSPEQATIDRQVRHLARLVDDLLDAARHASGKIELQRRPIELSEVVGRGIELARPTIDARRADLDLRVEPDLWIDADGDRMAQVVSNLLSNAAKYSDTGSRIIITSRRSGPSAAIVVKDHGVGVAPALIDRVFDLFWQEPQALDRARGGLGLGLAIVKNIVELHGGSVAARSEGCGCGSEFTVLLPLSAAAPSRRPEAGEPPRPIPAAPALPRILLVDDNEDAATMLSELLGQLGYEVSVAHDGLEALAVAERFRPEVALLDIGLPSIDGYELARRLPPLAADGCRLIAISGYGDGQSRTRSAEAGFEAHLVKPVRIEVLVRLLETPRG